MGCELCNNTKTENLDVTLTRKDNKQINKLIIKKDDSVASTYRSTNFTDTTRTYRISIEDKLNTTYSIPFKSEIANLDLKRNTNNINKYNTRNKFSKGKKNEVLSSILKEKGELTALELNCNFSGITTENNNKLYTQNFSILPEIIKRVEDEDDVDVDDEEGENEEEEEEQEDLIIDNDENNKNLELNQMSKNIESLLKQIEYSKLE